MSGSSNTALAIIIPILLIGSAFFLGIIEFSPQNAGTILQRLDSAKQEIIDVTHGKTTLEDTYDKVQSQFDQTAQKSGTAFENVVQYAKKTVDPNLEDETRPEFDPYEIEKLVHDYTNVQRQNYGLSKLKFNSEISEIARNHSQDMAERGYFAHVTPEGIDPTGRAKNAGYSCTKLVGIMIYSGLAENIFQGYLFDSYFTINGVVTSHDWNSNEEIAKITVDGWMESSGHRKNILTDLFDREGIGVFITEDDKIFVTQNFC